MNLTLDREVLLGAVRKLDPRAMARTPVMLVVEIGAVATTVLSIADPSVLGWMVTVWLWLTVLFANLAESVAEGRGKAQAASLRALQQETTARRVPEASMPNACSSLTILIITAVRAKCSSNRRRCLTITTLRSNGDVRMIAVCARITSSIPV